METCATPTPLAHGFSPYGGVGDMSLHTKICMGSPGMLYLNVPVTKFCELSYGLLYKYSIPTTFVKTPLPTTFVDLNSMKQAGAELCQAQSSAKLTTTHKLVANK